MLPAFLKVKGLVKQHTDSFNYFVNVGIKVSNNIGKYLCYFRTRKLNMSNHIEDQFKLKRPLEIKAVSGRRRLDFLAKTYYWNS